MARIGVVVLLGLAWVLGAPAAAAQQPADDPYGSVPVAPPVAPPPAAPPATRSIPPPKPAPPPAAMPAVPEPSAAPAERPEGKAPEERLPESARDATAPPETGDKELVRGEDDAEGEHPGPSRVSREVHEPPPSEAHEALHGEGDEGVHGQDHESTEGHHEAPGTLNFMWGMLGESEKGPHGLLYRPVGMPPPLLALILNTAAVFCLLYFFGRVPVQQALQQRRATILRGMEEAAKMKSEAEARVREYEARLDHLDQELERMKEEMREQAEAERERILADARAKREKMEQEARRMVELELKAARERLQAVAVRSAVIGAEEVLHRELGSPDHRRLLQRHVADLKDADLGGVV